LSSYEILAPLGAGGMGEVYRARDLKLHRDVAIKILPAAFSQDSGRISRFQREAQILASLNHSNIAAIHDFQEAAGAHFLVMELVEGETLAQRLSRGPLPVDEALEVCRQVAEALEAAHGKEVLHRDLKPGNIQLTPDGRVKVLDFGLAKIIQPEESLAGNSNSPTLLGSGHTGDGVILGTAAYMSPEQTRGRALDKGADLWALGCVLFEALTAKPAFNGEDVAEILANVMKSEPEWKLLPSDTPPVVRSLLRQCLQKQSKRRLNAAGAAKIMLEDAIRTPWIAEVPGRDSQTPRSGWKRTLPFLAASMFAAAIAFWMFRLSPSVDRSVMRVNLDVAPAERFDGSTGSVRPSRLAVAVSPDGRTVVFSAMRGGIVQLFKRALEAEEAVPIPGTEGARGPFLSPNGQWVGFWSGNKLKKAPLEGGPPVEICDVAADPAGLFGANWGSDDTIVFSAHGTGIARVPAGGGTPSELTKGDASKSEGRHIQPHLLPGGRAMLYTIAPNLTDWDHTSIVVESFETHQRQTLIRGGADPRYVSTGHLLYMKSGTLMAVGFDAERLELKGSPVAVLDNVMQAVNPPWNADETGIGQFTVAANGTLVYVGGGIHPTPKRDLVWVDRKGEFSRLAVVPGAYFAPRVSPDMKWVAFHAQRERSREYMIWSYDMNRQTMTRLTLEGDNCCVVWSPNSDSIAIRSVVADSSEILRIPINGTRERERLAARPFNAVPTSWSPSNVLAFTETHDSISQIWTLPLDDRAAKPLLQMAFPLNHPVFSPDGRWIAYSSTESGAQEVYVQAFPGPGEKIRISLDGGNSPAWAGNGRELFYQQRVDPGTRMMAVDIDTRKGFEAGKPHQLFEGPYALNNPMRGYDVTPDGQHFVLMRPSSELARVEQPFTQMHVVLNWTEELKRRAPAQ
jgi:serine/threonine protein kinase/Tol biopolymer transport system component